MQQQGNITEEKKMARNDTCKCDRTPPAPQQIPLLAGFFIINKKKTNEKITEDEKVARNDTCKCDRIPLVPQQIPLPAPCALLMGNSAMHWPKLSERKKEKKQS